jgi:hypothetical protein
MNKRMKISPIPEKTLDKTYEFFGKIILALLIINFAIVNVSAENQSDSTKSKDPFKRMQKVQYDVDPSPVHQWIALQAYLKLPTGDLKTELTAFMPTDPSSSNYSSPFTPPDGWRSNEDAPYIQSTSLIEGTWEEDNGEFFPGTTLPLRSAFHFWNPDSLYNIGLDLTSLGYGVQPSALEAAQARFYKAISYYNAGDKTKAYYWLGRTAQDLTVPAHVQLDEHLTDGDNYESFIKSSEFHYKHITSISPSTTIPNQPYKNYARYTPSSFNATLTDLLYQLADITDQFDSDDKDGDSDTYGYGYYRRASNMIDANKTFDRALKITTLGGEVRTLSTPTDYVIVDCSWSQDASIIYSLSFYNEINNDPLHGVRVYYGDGSYQNFFLLDENHVPWAVCGEIFQPQLQSRAIGYTAALYQEFWKITHPSTEDNYEENDDIAHAYDLTAFWNTWLHNINGLGKKLDEDWYKIYVPPSTACLYIECRFINSQGDIDIELYDSGGSKIPSNGSTDRDVERICMTTPNSDIYYVKVCQIPYNGNSYDLWWGSNCTEKIVLSSPPNGYVFQSCNPKIVLYWNLANPIDKVRRYEVQVDDNPNFDSYCSGENTDSLWNYFEPCDECGGLVEGTYYWRVRAQTNSPCNLFGDWSDTWSFRIGCTDLTIDTNSLRLIPNPVNPRELTFDWSAVSNTSGYNLEIDTCDALFSHLWCDEIVFESQSTKFIPLVNLNQIHWRVKALGLGSCPDGQWAISTITDVKESESSMRPTNYLLFQSYPNPFNPSTIIKYELAQNTFVTLTIYDVLGKLVKILVYKQENAGPHSVTLDASKLPSGVYFYQLQAGAFVDTKKLVLLR